MGIGNSGMRAVARAAGLCAALGVGGCPGATTVGSERGTMEQASTGPVFAPEPGPASIVPVTTAPDAGADPAGLAGFTGGGDPQQDAGTAPDAAAVPTDAGTAVTNPDDPHDALRTACVEHINMYRAMLGLNPLVRASADDERCSDEGAEYDVDNGAHESVGGLACRDLGGQNTCPGYPAPGGDVEATLRGCLDQMWGEGAPPVPVDDCIQDYANCFLMHGHYINMADPDATRVSCGFFQMPNGRWWMNQDFGR